MRVAWIGLGTLAVATAAGAGEGREGRVERVEHRRSEMVLVPAGPFTMGYPEPKIAEIEGEVEGEVEDGPRERAVRDCTLVVGAGAGIWCVAERAFQYLASQDWLYLFPYVNAVPEREVFLPAFELDRYEVTLRRYRACVAVGACDSGPLLQGDQRGHADGGNPVTNVTWREATEYCAFVGKRLPTEAEWEKAARGTDGRQWPWGDQPRADGSNHGTMEAEAVRMTHAMQRTPTSNEVQAFFELVGDASDGAEFAVAPGTMRWSESRYGALDMAGNVSEWVADYYGAAGYGDLPTDSPVRRIPENADTRRAVRGGSWLDLALAGRTFARGAARPGARSPLIGFRCARDA
jgi:formylglycine-generating enzyme required for sulfatase activity